jgi:O-methyltransferase
MDIDCLSFWHNPNFIKENGGFFPNLICDSVQREIVETCTYDLVRRDLIVLLLRTLIQNKVDGEIVELGVYRGETTKIIHHYCPERVLNLFDTFNGFDKRDIIKEDTQIRNSESVKEFKDTTEEIVLKFISPKNDNVKIFKGYFPNTLDVSFQSKSLSFVHLDADLYEPTQKALNIFYPKLSKHGIILIHDYNAWPGVRKAVDEFLLDKKEIPIPMPDKSGSAIIVKA